MDVALGEGTNGREARPAEELGEVVLGRLCERSGRTSLQ